MPIRNTAEGVSFPRDPTRARTLWTPIGRWLAFLLGASSIACLLFDFYRLCSMAVFVRFIYGPAMIALLVLALVDRRYADGKFWRGVFIGIIGGLIAAAAYDLFRLPFVFAREWHLTALVPPMNLFKVFPRFGAMILAQPIEQQSYSGLAQVLGWLYHFSNGAAFGVMYMALVGDARLRHWSWGIAFAVTLELGMLLTPYPRVFRIEVTPRFVAVTLAAHSILGVGLGLVVRSLARRMELGASIANAVS